MVACLTTAGAVAIDWLARGGVQNKRNPITTLARELFEVGRNVNGAEGVVFSQASSVEIAQGLRLLGRNLGLARRRFTSVASEHYAQAFFGDKSFTDIPSELTLIQQRDLDFGGSGVGRVFGGFIQCAFRVEQVLRASSLKRDSAIRKFSQMCDALPRLDLGYVVAKDFIASEIKQIAGPQNPAMLALCVPIFVAAESYFGISRKDLMRLHYAIMSRDHGIIVSIED